MPSGQREEFHPPVLHEVSDAHMVLPVEWSGPEGGDHSEASRGKESKVLTFSRDDDMVVPELEGAVGQGGNDWGGDGEGRRRRRG